MAIFFSAATLAGAFGGLLARGITEMKGVGGKPGWAWIFILEGLATVAIGKANFRPGFVCVSITKQTYYLACSAYWVINDYPET